MSKLVELNEPRFWVRRKKYIHQAKVVHDQGGEDQLGQELIGDRLGVLADSLDHRAFGCKVAAASKD